MQQHRIQQTVSKALLALALFILTACRSGTSTQSAAAPTTPPTPTQGVTPTPTIPAAPSQQVHFFASDHVQLTGLLYGHGKTIVVCSHESRTTKAIWSDSGVAQRLALRGYQVLTYDFRGNGDSAGPSDINKLDVDLQAAITFVRTLGATQIVLLGSSMGGTTTLKVAARQQVRAVVTLSAPQNFINYAVSDTDMRAIHAPLLFVNSQSDDYANDTMRMYTAANQPKELHMYPGGAHGTAIFDGDNGSDLTQRLLNFVTHYAPPG